METSKLKKFAQFARRSLIEQVGNKLKLVLAEKSAARRESTEAIEKLEMAIKSHGESQVIERVAYTWFNRFCALRFMDVNRYTRISVVSPAEGQFQPEILAEAKMGHIDEEIVHEKIRQKIFALLNGKAPSRDPQGEAYRLLVVAACNSWNKAMPFLFERIDDYTELLMPDDLLSGNSILAYTREAMTPDACEDVEVIGWLYQFYISEKKDEVFDGLKKNKKITPENIPAATQLFTPHWIVRYLVENSLGRLWMLNHPSSKLVEGMDYYIKPEKAETDFIHIGKPEEIKICDPACGSGHMLTYAFDLLYTIYEEEGYEPIAIPEKILTHNLYGIEIDERAGELAAFALTMKARAKHRLFLNKGVKPNICVLENIHFEEGELKEYMDFIERDLFTAPLQTTLHQFEEADNFGSLIRPDVADVGSMIRILELKNVSGNLFLSMTHQKVLKALREADYLSPKYHVVVANPPYMGQRGMNSRLAIWIKDYYPNSKFDLFATFIERNLDLVRKHGVVAMITMQSWMFLSSFNELRSNILNQETILSLVHIGARGFDSIGGEVVQTTAFVFGNYRCPKFKGDYIRLVSGSNEAEKRALFKENKIIGPLKFSSSASDFLKISGYPIVYSMDNRLRELFVKNPPMKLIAVPRPGLSSTNNERFLRYWFEPSYNKIKFDADSRNTAKESKFTWFPFNKGGDSRKWYGNNDFIVNWKNDGAEIKAAAEGASGGRVVSEEFYFQESVSASAITSGENSYRYYKAGAIFDVNFRSYFKNQKVNFYWLLGFLNSKVSRKLIAYLSPTVALNKVDLERLPYISIDSDISEHISQLILLSNQDWDNYEISRDFAYQPLVRSKNKKLSLSLNYGVYRDSIQKIVYKAKQLEEKNNRTFIKAYDLQDVLTPEVPFSEITLTCNPHYRYDGDKSEEDLETLLLADSMRDLVSYAVGCMFGRYSTENPGLILANQGEIIEDYLKQIPAPSFPADDDNVIPMLDGDWFTDDIAERFRKFLRVVFGEEHYEKNLLFVEQALNTKGKRNYSILDYFLGEFYTDHVKRYNKRPIYWLFSSPKGSFNALIYMHRYRPDTVSVVLNDYLREFRTKLTARKNHLEAVSISASASQSEKTKALKEIERLNKMIAEMEEYEREVLYPLATEQVGIDLDDGVKVNYPKFGVALKKIAGLS